MNLKEQIEQDLKTALLSGDKKLAMTLRGLKSAILYAEVSKGKREEGLSEDEIIAVLSKEAKSRQESADLYTQGNDQERAQAELSEKVVIEKYLPASLSEDDVNSLIDRAEQKLGAVSQATLGQTIGWVKEQSKGAADGALVARLVKERMAK